MKINEKNLCVFATIPPYDYEGFLNKRGEVNKAFQKRYFVLKGNLLFYFEKKGDKEPLGLIIVEGCTIELSEESDQYCFEIAFNGNRTYVLSADSQTNMEGWMKALTCAGYEYKKLMVAELQRQLEEIEDSRKKTLDDINIHSATPKPPPRRQNPFNRPAPPLPNALNGSSKQTASENIASSNLSTDNNRSENNPFKMKKPTTMSLLLRLYPDNIEATSINENNSGIVFDQLHERMRNHVLKDVFEYRKQKEYNFKPLIDI